MRDVAALAGVSLKTVSRVVNGEATVAADLAERVNRAATVLHYRPNLTARNLRRSGGRTLTIGLLLENVANPYSSAIHRAVEDAAAARGIAVLAGSVDESASRERDLALALVARRVDGLIIVPAGDDQSYLAAEQQAGLSIVFVDRPPRLLRADAVVSDNFGGAREAVRHLIAGGHRRIACLSDLASISTAGERIDGYVAALAEAGIEFAPRMLVRDLHDSDAAATAALAVMDEPDPPTALFTTQNLITIGAVHALRAVGREHAVALVGFDDFPLAELLQPAVTVVSQDPGAIGAAAADMLFARMDGSEETARVHTVGTRLVVRGSGEIAPPAS